MKVLLISGSPTVDSSVETLLQAVAEGIAGAVGAKKSQDEPGAELNVEMIRLNDLKYIGCQACGVSPEPSYCFFDDDLTPVYKKLIEADIVLLGSPVFFDSVSGQMKLFIDRCSCFRPPDFSGESSHSFKKRGLRRRVAGAVLVAGERGRFDLASSVIKGFCKWTEIDLLDIITYESPDLTCKNQVSESKPTLQQAKLLGVQLVSASRKISHSAGAESPDSRGPE